jgi:hypothetical protein
MKTSFAARVLALVSLVSLVSLASIDAHADDRPTAVTGGGPPAPASGWAPTSSTGHDDAPKPTTTTTTTTTTSTDVANPSPSKEANGPPSPPTTSPAADHPTDAAKKDPLTDATFLSGFRLGYSYVAKNDVPLGSLGGKSLADRTGATSPHSFLVGYELVVRLMGHSWLNVILLADALVAGLEQSKFLPSGNGLMGFEINNSFQLGVGAHLTPLKGQEGHVVAAAGWTPRVGNFYLPVHAFFVPDVEGNHRMGVLTGVTW